ncbi:unnamed protein product [Somion occarium]
MLSVYHRSETSNQVMVLGFLVVISLYLDVTIVQLARYAKDVVTDIQYTPPRPLESYSLIGTDFPPVLPVKMGPVKIVVEESVHYALTGPDSADEYLWTAPYGDNHIRLGEDYRAFAIPMFHQLHCLRGIREALDRGLGAIHAGQAGHIHHCFNYIRQWTLCSADVTLEPGDFTQRNFTAQRMGATYL